MKINTMLLENKDYGQIRGTNKKVVIIKHANYEF